MGEQYLPYVLGEYYGNDFVYYCVDEWPDDAVGDLGRSAATVRSCKLLLENGVLDKDTDW